MDRHAPYILVTIAAISSSLAGCADLTKLNPTAPTTFSQDVQTEQTLEAQLISDLRNEDKVLNYLSRGADSKNPYGCGNPKDKRLFSRLDTTNVKQFVKDEADSQSKAVRNALQQLDTYNKALNQIQQNDANFKSTLKTLDSLIDDAGKITGLPNESGAADAALPVFNGAVDFMALGGLQQLAQNMNYPLQNAVATLKKNLTELNGNELLAFQLWDECARETLAYIRDVPIGLVHGYSSFEGPSTGVELQTAYNNYLATRAKYQSPNLKADLDAIIDQNNNLIKGVHNNPDALISALSNGAAFASGLSTMAKAKAKA